MKKSLMMALTLSMALAAAGCAKSDTAETSGETSAAETTAEASVSEAAGETAAADSASASEDGEAAGAEENADSGEAVMSYDEYMAADLDSKIVIETYVQAKQSWWEDKATLYTQDQDGAYFVYNMACSEEDYEKLIPGTKIRVTGYKAEWSGEVELMDASFAFVEGGDEYIAPALDVTDLLGTDDLISHQNQFVTFKGMTVEAAGQDDSGNDVAFLYNWDGSGTEGDDLYFNVSKDGQTYTFTVESYLCDSTTDVYKAVQALEIGQTVDMEGFLYWYEGVNPHITSLTAAQ